MAPASLKAAFLPCERLPPASASSSSRQRPGGDDVVAIASKDQGYRVAAPKAYGYRGPQKSKEDALAATCLGLLV